MIRLAAVMLGVLVYGTPAVQGVTRPVQPRWIRSIRSQRVRPAGYPKIRSAVAALEAAKAELAAGGDFGGHKNEALVAVDNALKRLRLALQFSKY